MGCCMTTDVNQEEPERRRDGRNDFQGRLTFFSFSLTLELVHEFLVFQDARETELPSTQRRQTHLLLSVSLPGCRSSLLLPAGLSGSSAGSLRLSTTQHHLSGGAGPHHREGVREEERERERKSEQNREREGESERKGGGETGR